MSDNVATPIFRGNLGTPGNRYYCGVIRTGYTARTSTDSGYQAGTVNVNYQAVSNGTTVTVAIAIEPDSDNIAITGSTITIAFNITTSGQTFTVNVNVNTGLSTPIITFYYIPLEYTGNTLTIL